MGITQTSGFGEGLTRPVVPAGRFTATTDDDQVDHLHAGSLRLTAFLPELGDKALGLIGFGRDWSGPGGLFGLWVSADGALMLRHQDAEHAVQWQTPDGVLRAGHNLALSYQVWTDLSLAILRIEIVETGQTFLHRIEDTPPLPLVAGWSDLADVFVYAEVSSVPLRPSGLNGFAPGTCLPTGRGPVAVDALHPGDVLMAEDGPVAILDLRTEPVLPSLRDQMITLRAPYFGLDRDLALLPDQRVVIDAPEVESLLGHPSVLVAARDLAHPSVRGAAPDTGHLVMLELPRCATLSFGGCRVMVPACPRVSHAGPVEYLPGPGSLPWASPQEAAALTEPLARRRGRHGQASKAAPSAGHA